MNLDEIEDISKLVRRVLASPRLTPNDKSTLLRLEDDYKTKKGTSDGSGGKTAAQSSADRAAIYSLRHALDSYFDWTKAGIASPVRLVVIETPYRLGVVPNVPGKLDVRFWRDYLPANVSCQIVDTSPLVFLSADRYFVRFLDVNWESTNLDDKQIAEQLSVRNIPFDTASLKPCFHYYPAGEVEGVRILDDWFRSKGKIIPRASSKDCSEQAIWNKNIIVVGNNRTSWCVRSFQESLDFQLLDTHVHARERVNVRPSQDYCDTEADGNSAHYVVLTRRPRSVAGGGTITMIAGHNGRAIERVVRYVTTADDLEKLWAGMGLDDDRPSLPPKCFQVLFDVDIHHVDVAYGVRSIVDQQIYETVPNLVAA